MKNFEGNADSRLTTSRVSVLLACANKAAFIVFLTWFLFQHADPRGDGMEMAGVGFAFMLIFLPFTLPAFISHATEVGLCLPPDSPHRQQSRISVFGSKRSL